MNGKNALITYFGYWPEFCDSKLLRFYVDLEKYEILLSLEYLDVDQGLSCRVDFICSAVFELSMSELRSGAVIESLDFKYLDAGGVCVEVRGVYGVRGEFNCRNLSLEFTPN